MFDRFRDQRPVRVGLRRAGVHFARAVYEVVAGVGAFAQEVAAATRPLDEPDEDRAEPEGPTRIEVD